MRRTTTKTKRRTGAGVLAGVVAILVACGPTESPGTGDEDPGEAGQPSVPAPVAEPLADTLVESSLEGGDEVDGRVLVLWRASDEPLELVVEARGLPQGDHAWDIHEGSCTAAGPVALALSETAAEEGAVGPLPVDQTRMAEIAVQVEGLAGLLPSNGRYTLHIHEGPGIVHSQDTSSGPRTIACARL